jgi:hypothetical protein
VILIAVNFIIGCPLNNLGYYLSVAQNKRDEYMTYIIILLVLTRTLYSVVGGFMYTNFFKMLVFYTKKKKQIKKRLTGFHMFVISWTVGIVFLKISQILIILTWSTYFQVKKLPRHHDEIIVNIVFQKIYIPLCDFLVTLSFLYFFYQQKLRRDNLPKTADRINKSKPFSKVISYRLNSIIPN